MKISPFADDNDVEMIISGMTGRCDRAHIM